MSEQNETNIHEISKLFFTLLYNVQRTTKADWQSLDLTMAQFKVFLTLNFEGEVPISKLAHTLGISHPTASHLVERLVQAGLVERVELAADRRYTLARLTSQGTMMVQRLRQGRENHLQHWLVQLDEPDLAALRRGLEALNRVVLSSCFQEAGRCGSPDEHSPG
jgi:MarR family transcriptional regulator, organic hydroperoxide resistance regulator